MIKKKVFQAIKPITGRIIGYSPPDYSDLKTTHLAKARKKGAQRTPQIANKV
ncbi:hypothetical protein [Limnobaculum zhutongyuii]|uniref:hypothetical protein n=1 Tax=Limnobaculum zhutongyuii TaxID=2498113 RepID=UPI00143DDD8A|nr:hypothetical protein [Limnobaculum zhutongyuii]